MRQRIDLSRQWRFHLGEADNAFYKGYDDRAWRVVNIPHDWSVEAPFDLACSSGTGYLPGGVGWYRKTFTLPKDLEGKQVLVTFGGVYQHSRCWINSAYLGMRAYGYSSFTYDITGQVKPGENVLCVRAEHSHLSDSRWFTGAGIYRDVTLTLVEAAHISDVFARTLRADETGAEIAVDVACAASGTVAVKLLDAKGCTVAQATATALGEGASFSASLQVAAPALWSPESPSLYQLVCTLTTGGALTDELRVPFGIRVFRFDANHGFFLNQINTKLKGVCLHHDAGVLGAAVPMAVWRTRLQKLKAVGCNAIRFSHNPPDSRVLDLCDQLGFLVIDEAFDEWEGCKNKWTYGHNVYPPKHYGYSDDFPQWHERDLADLVRRDRNHACVILWSIGNEIDYPNDPYVHAAFNSMTGNNDANKPEQERIYDPNKPDAGRLPMVARELVSIVKHYDMSRPVTLALAYPELSNLTGLSDTVDVAGYNYKEHLYEADHQAHPARILFGSENGKHVEAWQAVKNHDYIAGQFLWTGADFLGEALGWPVRISQAGLLDTANHEKPTYYHRKALWTEALFAKLATSATGQEHDESFCWNYRADEPTAVVCYTNAKRATLSLNSCEIGTADVGEDLRAVWQVPFAAGELRVRCERDGETVEDALFTAGAPARLTLACACTALPADGVSVATLEITVTDDGGRLVTDADEPVTLQILGDMALLGIENGDPKDLTPFASASRPTYQGRAVAYLRAGTLAGDVELCAWTRGGLRQTLRFTLG